MNAVILSLLKLQTLEFGEVTVKNAEAQIAELRAQVPAPILGHYDRLRVRGKKGVAVVRNSVCGGCHMRQPIGKLTIVMRGEDVQLCDTCGRYLYLPEGGELTEPEAAAASPAEAPAAEVTAKPRKRAARKAAPAEAKPAKAKAVRPPKPVALAMPAAAHPGA